MVSKIAYLLFARQLRRRATLTKYQLCIVRLVFEVNINFILIFMISKIAYLLFARQLRRRATLTKYQLCIVRLVFEVNINFILLPIKVIKNFTH